MIEPWFDAYRYAWVPGTAYGLAAGFMAALLFWLVPPGRARNLILRAWFALWATAVVLLLVGLVALVQGQPWGVWYSLLLPGAIGTLVVGANSVAIQKRYIEIEGRRMAAKDLL
jgi:hypothetical protein